jgi:UDP-glucose 4-epimerase
MREDDDSVLGATSVGRWSYAAAKAIDEFLGLAYFKERKLPVVIVRFFNIVGPGQLSRYGMVLPKFIRAALEGKPLKVHEDGSQTRSFTYVEDAVRAVVDLSLEKKAEGEVVNVGNNHPVSIKALALMVKKTTHSVSKIQYVPYSKAYGRRSADFEDMPCRVPDIAKIKKLIGYRPKYDLEKIIRNTLQYTLRGQMEK